MSRALAAAALALLLAACGGGAGSSGDVSVFAASSLTEVFQALDSNARYNFAGSDELATQIEEGGGADVYAAASPKYPSQLFAQGLVEKPQTFATNKLVLIVPKDNPAGIESVEDLMKSGVKLVVGAEGVPIGDYTRTVLANMNDTAVLDNVVSEEDDVKGVVSKVSLGDADAGFVYATDVQPAADEVRAIDLPADAQAQVEYQIAIVEDAEHRAAAQEFVDLVLGEDGQNALRLAGFGQAP